MMYLSQVHGWLAILLAVNVSLVPYKVKVKVKFSRYRPEQALEDPKG
jgi:hypothetical protein